METKLNRPANEFEEDDDDLFAEHSQSSYEDFCMTILDFLTRTIRRANVNQLKTVLQKHNPSCVEKLLNVLQRGSSDEDIIKCSESLQTAFESLKKQNENNLMISQ